MPKYYVHRYRILGTPFIKYSVWEKRTDWTSHSTISHAVFDGVDTPIGDITTRTPSRLKDMPYGAKRTNAVLAHYDDMVYLAIRLVHLAYPHLDEVCLCGRIAQCGERFNSIDEAALSMDSMSSWIEVNLPE